MTNVYIKLLEHPDNMDVEIIYGKQDCIPWKALADLVDANLLTVKVFENYYIKTNTPLGKIIGKHQPSEQQLVKLVKNLSFFYRINEKPKGEYEN